MKQRRSGPTSLNTASRSEDLKVYGRFEPNTVEGLCPPPAPPVAASPSAAASPPPPPRCFRLLIAGVVEGRPWELGVSRSR
uniref:Uncharacterized protein n=1 Tax=Arundo donax TaxID=35708 RepID=A0A0A9H6Z5_ARUDO